MANHVFVGVHVFIPVFAFVNVGLRKLPVLFRLIKTRKETAALLLFRNVEKKLSDYGAIAREITLEIGNVFKPIFPDLLSVQFLRKVLFGEKLRMHTHHQHLFII